METNKIKGIKYVSMPGGYGVSAQWTMRALLAQGVPLTWTPLGTGRHWGKPVTGTKFGPPDLQPYCNRPIDYDTVIVHLQPEYIPQWRQREKGKRLIAYTAWEHDVVPPTWNEWLQAADAVVMPCQWNARVVEQGTSVERVRVIPHPCDLAEPPPIKSASGSTCFYVIGEWQLRKNIEGTIRAFCQAFTRRDAVRLVVKTSPNDLCRMRWPRLIHSRWGRLLIRLVGLRYYPSRRHFARLCRDLPDAPPIEFVDRALSPDAVVALHDRGDVFVSLCHSEGWGLGAFEAAARGKPVIITGYGGQLDYLGEDYPWLIDYARSVCRVSRLEESWHFYDGGGWADPRPEHAVELMRSVHGNLAEARTRARTTARRICEDFSMERIAHQWLEVVRETRARTC